ncbi:MAG: DCC1-like thiol-disulfide oxidoreductase family protein, partial [Myxococcota bacterium]
MSAVPIDISDEQRGRVVVFYDGVCGMCNWMVNWTMGADREFRLLYAPLQGRRAQELLAPHGI